MTDSAAAPAVQAAAAIRAAGKDGTAPPPTPKKDPWRGTSGSQTLRSVLANEELKTTGAALG